MIAPEIAVAMLRDKDTLRSGLSELDNRELGVVLALVLSQLDQRGRMKLSDLIQGLADQVREQESLNPPWSGEAPTAPFQQAHDVDPYYGDEPSLS